MLLEINHLLSWLLYYPDCPIPKAGARAFFALSLSRSKKSRELKENRVQKAKAPGAKEKNANARFFFLCSITLEPGSRV
jgi:hypothetical protein